VVGEIVEQKKDKKVVIFKAKRRKSYRKKQGHRQNHTVLRITAIKL
jgi:large subunit ribosomal protein L21